jgi:LPS-assembly protein
VKPLKSELNFRDFNYNQAAFLPYRMKFKHSFYLLFLSLCSLSVVAQETCPAPANTFVVEKRLPNGQIKVVSNMTSIQQDNFAEFEGNVEITNENSQIIANKAQINRATQQLIATGDVSYQNPQLSVKSQKVLLNTQNNHMEIADTRYELTTLNARGDAELLVVDQTEGLELNGVTFSTCPTGQEDWLVHASSIKVKPNETRGVARDALFYVQDVPIFYLPYYSFPVTDERETGLLFPQIGSSSNTGFAYEQPLYLNLGEQYDATITPRYMTKRGLQLKTEFRYLTEQNSGQIDIEYLNNDQDSSTREDRYFYRFVHKGAISDDWEVNVDFNGISDDNYISDLGSSYYSQADTHLYRTLGVYYYTDKLTMSMQLRDFEIIGDHDDTYRALPEFKLDYVTDLPAGFKFDIHSELANFDNANGTSPKAVRAHIAPTISLPLENSWGEFLAETSIMHTAYIQDNIEDTDYTKKASRTLGQGKLYGALVFDRDIDWFGKHKSQTLEPKVQYIYTTYENQTNIGLYDTTRLYNDYAGLFRGQEFTGLDRISDKNQITLGITSRIIDEDNREQFKLSLGQIFYLADNKVTAATKEDDRSALAAELDWTIGRKWSAYSDIQVSTQTDKVERSSFGLEYRRTQDKMIQLNHRYVRDLSGEKINQLGLTASWPLAQNWSWVGRWYRDMDRNRTIESYTGVQYESCCWAIRVVAQRELTSHYDDDGVQSTDYFDSGFSVQFVFKGIGSDSAASDMLEDGLFGYQQKYLLD